MKTCVPYLRQLLRPKFILRVLIVTTVVSYYFGLFAMTMEKDYKEIEYYLEHNISLYVNQLLANKTPSAPPVNYYNYTFLNKCNKKCELSENEYSLRLVYIVKSACSNFARREAIRKSWGFEKRFSDVSIRTVFILGLPVKDQNLQAKIDKESLEKGDIVQANFVDSYFNNTIKTMMGIKWAVTFCHNSKFYFFSDDDVYISTKNVLRFIRNPLDYPNYLRVPFSNENIHDSPKKDKKLVGYVMDMELPEGAELYAGYMFSKSRPQRHLSGKWYISLEEYPFSRYPPYITAGAYVLSNVAVRKFYYASFYVQHFRFDDIYLSFLSKASNIVPVHNDEFYFYKKPYDINTYWYVIASHGYGNPEELLKVWHNEKAAGNA